MRLIKSSLLALAIMAIAAGSASAVTLTLSGEPGAPINVGDSFVLTITATDGANINAFFASVQYDPSILQIEPKPPGPGCNATKTCAPPSIFGEGGYALNRLADPGTDVLHPPGLANAVAFAGDVAYGGFGSPGNGVVGYMQFTAIGGGTTGVITLIQPGVDDITFNNYVGGGQAPLTNNGVSVTVLPEPAVAMLVGLGLVGLAVAGRKI
jgi:hypothetical protein